MSTDNIKVLLMSTDKIYFHREIKFQYFLVIKSTLSGTMQRLFHYS